MFLAWYRKSRLGGTQLCLDGYTFCRKKQLEYKTMWVCSSHNNKGCRAKVVTADNKIIKVINDHTHYPVRQVYSKYRSDYLRQVGRCVPVEAQVEQMQMGISSIDSKPVPITEERDLLTHVSSYLKEGPKPMKCKID